MQFKSFWPVLDARGDIVTGIEAEADQAEGQPHPQGRSLRMVHALHPSLLRAFEHVVGSDVLLT